MGFDPEQLFRRLEDAKARWAESNPDSVTHVSARAVPGSYICAISKPEP